LVLPLLLLGLSCYLSGVCLGRGCLVLLLLVVVFVVCLRSDLPEGCCRMLLGLSVALLLVMMRVARLLVVLYLVAVRGVCLRMMHQTLPARLRVSGRE